MNLALAVDGWAVTFGMYSKEGTGQGRPLLAVPNVTAHPSTARVPPLTILLYNGLLVCDFNVSVKG